MRASMLLDELVSALRRPQPEAIVVMMPDFFLDHIVTYRGDLRSFLNDISRIARQGGGNIPWTRQEILRGGNATNTASALSKLGVRPFLLLRTSPLGLSLLERLVGEKVDLSHIKVDGKMALTVALELEHEGKSVNIMLGDPASVADFGADSLSGEDCSLIRKADAVCVFNWNLNLRGTELAKRVFELVKGGRGMSFFDSGDPSPRSKEIGDLMENVLERGLVDVFSLNENEAIWYASYLDERIAKERKGNRVELAIECSRILRDKLGTRIDLHTSEYSATFGKEEVIVPTFSIPVKRVTGAGDVWNAADIYGYIAGLRDDLRLLLANATAAYYISSPTGEHPTREDIIDFLQRNKLKELRA